MVHIMRSRFGTIRRECTGIPPLSMVTFTLNAGGQMALPPVIGGHSARSHQRR
jgi:hypothetical protein